jgi:sec-independent protein translocase protein TatA
VTGMKVVSCHPYQVDTGGERRRTEGDPVRSSRKRTIGKRLPEVGKSLGKGIVEFKKGLKGVKDEMDGIDSEVQDAVDRSDQAKPEPPKLSAAKSEPPMDAPKPGEREEVKSESESRSPQPGA